MLLNLPSVQFEHDWAPAPENVPGPQFPEHEDRGIPAPGDPYLPGGQMMQLPAPSGLQNPAELMQHWGGVGTGGAGGNGVRAGQTNALVLALPIHSPRRITSCLARLVLSATSLAVDAVADSSLEIVLSHRALSALRHCSRALDVSKATRVTVLALAARS